MNLQRRGVRCLAVCPRTDSDVDTPIDGWILKLMELINKKRRPLFLCTLHSLWIGRNKLVFEEIEAPPDLLLQNAISAAAEATST
ncbi:hypothetical protein PIB30_023285, partial [Stylosanthes scabra]|nr:hypothetical protein [Stylosanthes scabra]